MSDPRPLTAKQRRAARLDAYGHVRETIAARVGCSVRVLSNWRKLPAYVAERERVAEEMPEEDSVAVLRDLLHSDQDAIRLRAAEVLLKIPGLPADDRQGVVEIHDHAAAAERVRKQAAAAPAQ